jgi:hypothetical protein
MALIEESCSLIGTWIEPKYIIPATMMLLSSGLFPFLLHKYKMARERKEKLFDTRKSEYQEYFKVMESAARLAGQDYDKFLSKTLPEASLRLYKDESSPESIVNYQNTLNEFTKGVQEGFQKATHELVGLRIVCSDALAELLDRFESLYKEILTLQPMMLQEIRESVTPESFISGEFNFETPTQVKMVEMGTDLGLLRDEIIKQMRSELGYKS